MNSLRSTLALLLVSGGALASGDAFQTRVRNLEAELAKLGKPFAQPCTIVSLSAGEYQDRTRAELERLHGAGWLELQAQLREALGVERGGSVETTRAAIARATYGDFGVFGSLEQGGQLVVDASREDSIEQGELLRALSTVWRLRNDGEAKLFGERRTQESTSLRWGLLMGEGDLAALALSEQRAQRDPRKLDPSALDAALPADRGNTLLRELHRAGRDFAIRRLRDFDWAGITTLHAESPTSTEQLLHPEKLYKDQPRAIALPEWPAEWKLQVVRDDSLGELGLQALLLDAGVPKTEARLATIGWDGDHLQLVRDEEGHTALVWRLAFDRLEDTVQFAEAFKDRALGSTSVRGFSADFVRSDSIALAQKLGTALVDAKPGLKGNKEDMASTEVLESGLKALVDFSPRIEEGRWVLPRYQLSLPVLENWRAETLAGQPFLVGPQIGAFKDNIGVVAGEERESATLADWLVRQEELIKAQGDLTFVFAERRTLRNREFGWLRYEGKIANQYLECTVLVYLLDGRPVVVTASIHKDNVEWLRPRIEACLLDARVEPIRPREER